MSSHSDSVAYEMERPAPFARQQAHYTLNLRVVPVEAVVPHEHYHARRVAELATRLAAEGKLVNPPIVARQGEKYVVLDGATRLTALRQLGYPTIIVQVVELVEQQVQLASWHHVVFGGTSTALLETVRGVPGLQLTPVAGVAAMDGAWPAGALACLVIDAHACFWLEAASTAGAERSEEWLAVLNALVAAYGEWGNVERTLSRDVAQLASQFPDFAALMIFPHFEPEMLLALAGAGKTVPAGITRFVIPGRILRLNAPLAKLAADEPLAAKQAWLDQLISAKLLERQVRFYEEPVVLLDE